MLVSYSGLQEEEEYFKAIDEFEKEILKQPRGIKTRVLVDVTGSILTAKITERNKEVERKAREKGIPDGPTALVGVSGFKMAVVQAMSFLRPNLHVAKSEEAAKDWLVERVIDG
jgi:hypothetical protein